MALHSHVFEPRPAGPTSGDLAAAPPAAARRWVVHVLAALRRAPEIGGLVGIAALLNLWALGRNGWANTYYSAAVRSMAASWHDFLYASMDPSGVMTVDKPPLALWIQALSVRLFGFHPLAILVPQALMGIATVVLVYDLVRRRFGRLGGFVAGLALATTRSSWRCRATTIPTRSSPCAASPRSGSRCAGSRTGGPVGWLRPGSPSVWALKPRCSSRSWLSQRSRSPGSGSPRAVGSPQFASSSRVAQRCWWSAARGRYSSP